MNKRGASRGKVLGILALIVIAGTLLKKALPFISQALVWVVVIAGIAFVVFIIAIILKGFNSKEDVSKKNKTGSKPGKLSNEDAAKLKDAGQQLVDARMSATHIKDESIRSMAMDAVNTSEKILKTLRKQPEEIRRAHQYLNYYLPTLNVVLNKYRNVEANEVERSATEDKIKSYLSDICKAMDKQYKTLFDNEILDLSVEMEAMQIAFKRDGLIEEADIPQDRESDISLTL